MHGPTVEPRVRAWAFCDYAAGLRHRLSQRRIRIHAVTASRDENNKNEARKKRKARFAELKKFLISPERERKVSLDDFVAQEEKCPALLVHPRTACAMETRSGSAVFAAATLVEIMKYAKFIGVCVLESRR